MIDTTKIPSGYKQTNVGIIPEDWEVKGFCEIGKLSKGKGLLKEEIKRSGSIPAIPYTALYTDYSEVLDYNLIKWFIDDESQSVIVSDPCLLLASSSNMEANTGKASALIGNTSVAIGREIIIFKTSADCIFISYLLSTPSYRKKTLTLARGTTIKHLYPATFQDYQVALPPFPEQQSIAEVLSDVDALITSLDQLITKKRNIKRGTIQLLLTGKKRLPNFSGDWETKKLGEIAEIVGGGTPSTFEDKFWDGNISWFTPTEIGKYKYTSESERKITKEGLAKSSANILPIGTILLTTRAGIGDLSILLKEGCTNQGFQSLIAKNSVDNEFLYYLVFTLKDIFIKNASGSTFLEISPNKIRQVEIKLPPKGEQKAIAQILSEMDAEIESLETQRDKYKAVKQGIMQELLTGKTRLI